MSIGLSLNDLMEYTDWERGRWRGWLKQQGDQALAFHAGPHGDGRFESVGDLVRHIFAAEKRYIEWLSNRPLTDPASIPNNGIEALFQFGRQSRRELQQFAATFPAEEWDAPKDLNILSHFLRATPKKIVIHILIHEIRHWAQIGTLFRLNGFVGEFHDFLFSPVFGGEFRRLT